MLNGNHISRLVKAVCMEAKYEKILICFLVLKQKKGQLVLAFNQNVFPDNVAGWK